MKMLAHEFVIWLVKRIEVLENRLKSIKGPDGHV
jgi:hypothetical protein